MHTKKAATKTGMRIDSPGGAGEPSDPGVSGLMSSLFLSLPAPALLPLSTLLLPLPLPWPKKKPNTASTCVDDEMELVEEDESDDRTAVIMLEGMCTSPFIVDSVVSLALVVLIVSPLAFDWSMDAASIFRVKKTAAQPIKATTRKKVLSISISALELSLLLLVAYQHKSPAAIL